MLIRKLFFLKTVLQAPLKEGEIEGFSMSYQIPPNPPLEKGGNFEEFPDGDQLRGGAYGLK